MSRGITEKGTLAGWDAFCLGQDCIALLCSLEGAKGDRLLSRQDLCREIRGTENSGSNAGQAREADVAQKAKSLLLSVSQVLVLETVRETTGDSDILEASLAL